MKLFLERMSLAALNFDLSRRHEFSLNYISFLGDQAFNLTYGVFKLLIINCLCNYFGH